jgi:putative ABC transport system substrate-binding protein
LRRREFIALIGGIVAAPLGHAQGSLPGRAITIGVLSRVAAPDAERFALGPFREALKSQGWVDGQNLTIYGAFADFQVERLPALAEELVRKRVDLIWAPTGEAAVAAARASRTIPIVFIGVPWPVESGLVDSIARPGRNATGVALYTGIEVSTKRLEFLRSIAPAAKRLSWIIDANAEATVSGGRFDQRPALESAAKGLGYEVRFHYTKTSEDLERALAEIREWPAQSLAVAASAVAFGARERIAMFAQRHKLPSAFVTVQFVEAGGLLSYQNSDALTASITRSAHYADRILRGAKPSDLPVEMPSKYELVINAKTAKALGLTIPQSLLLRAARVIE